jgi:hypothetical protein
MTTKNNTDATIKRYNSRSNQGHVRRCLQTSGGTNKGSPAKMGLQLSESIDISNCGQLLDFLGTSIKMK